MAFVRGRGSGGGEGVSRRRGGGGIGVGDQRKVLSIRHLCAKCAAAAWGGRGGGV